MKHPTYLSNIWTQMTVMNQKVSILVMTFVCQEGCRSQLCISWKAELSSEQLQMLKYEEQNISKAIVLLWILKGLCEKHF